jgi:hypothetical protein
MLPLFFWLESLSYFTLSFWTIQIQIRLKLRRVDPEKPRAPKPYARSVYPRSSMVQKHAAPQRCGEADVSI